jgi:hypothetical protein
MDNPSGGRSEQVNITGPRRTFHNVGSCRDGRTARNGSALPFLGRWRLAMIAMVSRHARTVGIVAR